MLKKIPRPGLAALREGMRGRLLPAALLSGWFGLLALAASARADDHEGRACHALDASWTVPTWSRPADLATVAVRTGG